MIKRLRATSLAGSSALVLVLAVSGVVAAGSVLTAIAAPTAASDEPVVDTTVTWEDLNGNGIDDDCEVDEVLADEQAAADAEAAVDLDGDGTISVSEGAQSERTGGTNCNHGGYVSTVAQGTCDAATEEDETDAEEPADGDEPADSEEVVDGDETSAGGEEAEAEEAVDVEADVDCDATEEEDPAEDAKTAAECETAESGEEAPVDEPAVTETDEDTTEVVNNGHGKVVREVARDEAAVGGKNCNHGGAVSEASHADNDARKAAREAAKEARDAAREAARDARAAEKASKGKGKGHNH